MSDNEGGYDGLRLCARCHDQDTPDEICSSCKRELVAHYDGDIGWRAAWQKEQEEKTAQNDPEVEALMLDLLTLAGTIQHEQYTQSSRRVRAFALRLLRERQNAVNGALEEAAKNLEAGGSDGAAAVRAMKELP